jgi:flagellar motility protein MotE (MotC chaperone)
MTGKTKSATPRKRTLALVGTLLLISAVLRLATEAGQVIANEALQSAKVETGSDVQDLNRPENIDGLLKALKDREARVIAREQDVQMREKTIEVAEEQIELQLEKLERAEASLQETISLASKAAEEDLSQLTNVYSNMKPKQAAALFEQMDAKFAAGFLARMPSDSAARVLAGMTSEKAYHISVELAGRNADIPLE